MIPRRTEGYPHHHPGAYKSRREIIPLNNLNATSGLSRTCPICYGLLLPCGCGLHKPVPEPRLRPQKRGWQAFEFVAPLQSLEGLGVGPCDQRPHDIKQQPTSQTTKTDLCSSPAALIYKTPLLVCHACAQPSTVHHTSRLEIFLKA